ncbi:D-3-phosphoglycerate dehydrogenase [Dyadobacter koreensis]|uniref:D-3-phosphoglycerate dehydrogenase n=1 Tax=Dyadobacter koreensis TaxID=408657 RepID=A0A1H6Z8T8_9BACT|nr:phosphoglycerate dehydrogenase [Dyadobacter koreensis]SEJ49839.1 D-3-phosphoglycerate dehydrogenase [Dyadobacter koreensis]
MPTLTLNPPHIIIDFDSTFTKVEGLDELAAIALTGHPQREKIVQEIVDLTNKGMNGEMSFAEGLRQRIDLLKASRANIEELISFLKTKVSDSFKRNKQFLTENADYIFIVSSGFKEFIVPVVTEFGLRADHVYANEFRFDEAGNIIGIDEENVLSTDGGKIKLLSSLKLEGDVYAIGDGYTDYQIKEAGFANRFYAFTENVERPKVVAVADHIATSFDDFLYDNKLSRSQSYPKSRIKVLLLENVHPVALRAFEEQGFNVEFVKGALDEDELCERIKDVSIIGIRSKTNITKRVLENANRLMAIGAFCIGTNQIDLEAAAERGIAVFNAPYSNTRSVVELAIGEMIVLIRNIVTKSNQMHQGIWDKSANGSFEVRGKKLGMVGYGSIGTQLSVVAEALGMEVYFYDGIEKLSLGNARKVNSLEELLSIADVISMHVDGRKENTNLIGKREFDLMKDGVIFMNLSRGHVVDIEALADAVKSGKVAGASVDVFPKEPKTNDESFESALRGLPNVILTPHIGGSTEEAQENIGHFVPSKLLEFMNNGSSYGSVNFPEVQLPKLKDSHRLLHIHANVPGVLAKLNNIFAKNNINITGQYLKTSEKIGYVIVDIAKGYTEEFIQEVKEVEGTIRFRMLY